MARPVTRAFWSHGCYQTGSLHRIWHLSKAWSSADQSCRSKSTLSIGCLAFLTMAQSETCEFFQSFLQICLAMPDRAWPSKLQTQREMTQWSFTESCTLSSTTKGVSSASSRKVLCCLLSLNFSLLDYFQVVWDSVRLVWSWSSVLDCSCSLHLARSHPCSLLTRQFCLS